MLVEVSGVAVCWCVVRRKVMRIVALRPHHRKTGRDAAGFVFKGLGLYRHHGRAALGVVDINLLLFLLVHSNSTLP